MVAAFRLFVSRRLQQKKGRARGTGTAQKNLCPVRRTYGLQSLPDLSLPLDENDAVAGIEVDVTPHGDSKSAVSALAIRGKIVDEARPESVNLPLGYKLSRRRRIPWHASGS
jgi:hypothetical protein